MTTRSVSLVNLFRRTCSQFYTKQKATIVSGFVGIAVLLWLTACSPAATVQPTTPPAAPTTAPAQATAAPAQPTTAPAAAPKPTTPPASATTAATAVPSAQGKVLRIGVNVPPGDFNSLTAVNAFQYWSLTLMLSSLTQADADKGIAAPDLAESWDLAPDATSVTFHIRKNAKWHDGQPVTAKDVAFTFTSALNPLVKSTRAGGFALIKGAADFTAGKADKVTGINVIDDYTIRFDMEFPNGLFVNETAQRAQILPEHILGKVAPADLAKNKFFIDSVVGSGPYKMVRYVTDQYLELEANPDYFFGKPKVDRIVMSIIKSLDTMQVSLGRGELDMVLTDGGPLPTDTYKQFAADSRFKVVATGGGPILGYGFNFRKDYLKDTRLHQAFLYALDRKKLVQNFLGGVGSIPNSFLVHNWYQKPDWSSQYPFDPAKAKALLKDMNWDSNRELTVNILPIANEEGRAILAAQQQMLADVGIKIKFQELEVSVWVQKFYDTHDFELAYVTYGVFPDPDGFLYFHMHSSSKNAFGYANPDLDKRIEAGRRATTQADRIKVYQDIGDEVMKSVPLAPAYRQNFLFISAKRWSVPQVDTMQAVTSLDNLGPGKRLYSDFDAFLYHPEQWDLK